MEEKPNYYAIIPANVRYNKNLRANEKLLFGEITALSNATGICVASNNYFAKLYGVVPSAITKWIKDLEKYEYISVEYVRNDKEIKQRNIRLLGIHKYDEVFTNVLEGIHKCEEGYSQKTKDNNTSINNTSINNNIYCPAKAEQQLPYKEIIDYLNIKLGTHYKYTSNKTRALIKARFNEGYTLDDFKTVIDKKYIEWYKDKKMNVYLRPETLFSNKFESYLNQKKRELTLNDVRDKIDLTNFWEE